uniref:Uncharacterized protein n=1 Tax=Ciona savignyi TaxID=51511 RepID=H2YCS5_CIOSA
LATFTHTDLPRLTCASVDRSASGLSFATGGSKLLLWRDVGLKTTNLPSLEIKGKSHPDLNKVAQPSDEESCASETEDEGGWWWSRPVETGSTKKSEEQSDSDSDSSIEELKTKTAQNSWNWCSVV